MLVSTFLTILFTTGGISPHVMAFNNSAAVSEVVEKMDKLDFSNGGPSPTKSLVPRCRHQENREEQNSCNLRSLFQKHKERFPEDKEIILLPDNTAMINPLYSGIPSPRKSGERERARIARLLKDVKGRKESEVLKDFENTKIALIESITNGRDESEYSEVEELFIARIKKTKIKIDHAKCLSSWAAYETITQEIRLCDTALKMPKYGLISLLAHELSHSIDFCSASHPCYERVEGAMAPPSHVTSNVPGDYQDRTSRFFSLKSNRGIIIPHYDKENDPILEVFSSLERDRIVKKIDSGVRTESHPFRSTAKCLNAHAPSHYNLVPKELGNICGGTEFTELGAQIGGAKALASFIGKYPPKSDLERLSMMAFSTPSSFEGKYRNNIQGKEQDFNSIYLSQKEIQNSMGCSEESVPVCQ